MVCVAVIAKGEHSPNHLVGDPEAASLLMALDSVKATLVDDIPRTETPKPGTALAAAAFIALEPLGTGYSSLGHLSDYFFNEIKIDKSFVCQLDNGPYAQAIVKAVIVIAEAIGADVVAEGLELPSQIATVQQLGCTKGQGYYFSRPIPEPRWRQLLSNQNRLD
ncbi:EAL domain-containing protein [Nitrincola alkalilacustris]|uniref:EAL domain-containing protein n=1 Tax=Nitrincola alkalilacustris TaxID=1571224 RepID=UPI003B84A2E8